MQEEEFFAAIAAGDRERVEELLDSDPELVSATDEEGRSGLLLAVYHGHHDMVNLLTRRREEVDLFEASAAGHPARVLELVQEEPARVGYTSSDGFSPLGLAAFFGRPELVEVLLDAGADPAVPSRNAMRVRPLQSAAACADAATALSICRSLLAAGAEPDSTQAGGWTALHQAAAQDRPRLIRMLLDEGADPEARSDDGRTPLDMAQERGHDEVVGILKDALDRSF